MTPLSIAVLFVVLYLFSSVKILREYERGVIFRLGRMLPAPKGPGIVFVFAPIDRIVRVSLRVITLDIPPQDTITRDNVSIKVNAVVYFRVIEPNKAIVAVEDFLYATSQMSQTTLRSVIGQGDLDTLLGEREKVNLRIQEILDRQTDPWGVKVTTVEVKHIDLPQEMQRAMAKQAEAERERRAKVIRAEGEYQSAEKLVGAAKMMGDHPMSLQMRYLQTLVEVASEKNSTTIFPIPIDLFEPFLKKRS
ncbi:MAG: slipin family protein [Deltaproteobacteria bacterium]|nr:slipin family protein [Deltaproteobacteria bacterium]MBI4196429.1 slipin family protein [Deltaproteobacteria bacterium]